MSARTVKFKPFYPLIACLFFLFLNSRFAYCFSSQLELGTVNLKAVLSEKSPPLCKNVQWYIFTQNKNNNYYLVTSLTGGIETFKLPPRNYIVVASYGYANKPTPIKIESNKSLNVTINLSAGALSLTAHFPNRQKQPSEAFKFSLFSKDDSSKPYVTNITDGEVICLNSGTYQLITYYNGQEASQSTITVPEENLIQATVTLNSAQISMKLVKNEHGEALAGTQWSIIDASSDITYEKASAYISPVLESGEYHIIASNTGKLYEKTIKVIAGEDQTIEILTKPSNL